MSSYVDGVLERFKKVLAGGKQASIMGFVRDRLNRSYQNGRRIAIMEIISVLIADGPDEAAAFVTREYNRIRETQIRAKQKPEAKAPDSLPA